MKNLCSKSKGKIHPSPTPPTAAGDAISVLKLLPAAIFALTAVLGFEDKEVVAYLMLRSINGPGEAAEEQRRCRRIAGVHRPLFDCGCFDCYTNFWSRWDCSKDRETIHMVIEAFEEHLASKEKKGKETKRKRKKSAREEKEKEELIPPVAVVEEAQTSTAAAEETKSFEEEAAAAVSVSDETEEVELPPAVMGTEKKRGWPDVMGIFFRLWSLWSPMGPEQ